MGDADALARVHRILLGDDRLGGVEVRGIKMTTVEKNVATPKGVESVQLTFVAATTKKFGCVLPTQVVDIRTRNAVVRYYRHGLINNVANKWSYWRLDDCYVAKNLETLIERAVRWI